MLDGDTAKRLDQLEVYVGWYGSDDIDATNFWDGFWAIAGPVDAMAFAEEAEPELRERYTAILGVADERGFLAPAAEQVGKP